MLVPPLYGIFDIWLRVDMILAGINLGNYAQVL